jgi:hypothetical protein
MAKIEVSDVGIKKWCAIIDIPDEVMGNLDEVAERIYKIVDPHLMSRCIEVLWDGKEGMIVVGTFHKAGDIKLIKHPSETGKAVK